MSVLTALALAPVLLPQAVWLAVRAMRLPEADGPRTGQAGEGVPLRVLVLGDSSAAGVGVAHQNEALTGRLVAHLEANYAVQWTLWARSGLTTSGMLRMLCAKPAQVFDVAVVALGVNDTKNGMHTSRWQTNYETLLRVLRARHGVERIYVSGVPPLGAFPLLPRPLRDVLGARAARFDAALVHICNHHNGAQHMPFDLPLEPELMAADGFHPGAYVYDIWAQRIAAALRANPPTSAMAVQVSGTP